MSTIFGKAGCPVRLETADVRAAFPATGRFSVKTKVTLVATLLFLLSLILVSAIQLYNVKGGMKTLLAEQQHAFVVRVADELDQKLKVHLDFVEAGTRTIPLELVEDAGRLQKWADERHGLRAIFSDIIVISAQGVVLADTPRRGRHGIDVSDREYFRTTVETRKPYISKPIIGKSTKEPLINFSAPVLNKDGAVVLVLSGTLNLLQPNFLGNLADAKVGKSGTFSVFTRDRTIVISRDKSRILTQGPAPGVLPHFDHATSGLEGSEESVSILGRRAILSYTQLEMVPWVLVASMPIDEAYAPIQATQYRIVEVTLLLGLLVAPMAWLAVRRFYDPLRKSLGEQERRVRTIVESAPTGMVIIDTTGAMVMINAHTERLFGYKRDELLGHKVELLIPERFRRAHPGLRDGFFSAPQARQMGAGRELYGLRKDGAEIPVEIGLSPVEAEGGQLVLAVIVDITERKRQEQELLAMTRRLVALQESERRDLARELHDRVGQNLSAMSINLERLRADPASGSAALQRIDDSIALLEATGETVTSVLTDLKPPMLANYGLLDALRWHLREFKRRTGTNVEVDGPESPRLPAEVEMALFRITQAAISNTARYARARTVRVSLAIGANRIRFTIADDGVGFDQGAALASGRWGLSGIRERVDAIEGKLMIDSAPGHGTRIIVDVDITL